MSDLDQKTSDVFESGIVAALRGEGVTGIQLIRGVGLVRYSPEDFATWLRGEVLGFTPSEVDEALDLLVRTGRVESRINPITREEEFKIAGGSW